MKDALWAGLTDSLANMPMGVTAENLAVKYKITREEVDNVAIRSQKNYFKAKEAGIFKRKSFNLIYRPNGSMNGGLHITLVFMWFDRGDCACGGQGQEGPRGDGAR